MYSVLRPMFICTDFNKEAVYTHTYVRTYMHIYSRQYMTKICVRMYVSYAYVCMYICTCVHMHLRSTSL